MKGKTIGKPIIAIDGDADVVIGNLRARQDMEIGADLVQLFE
jgi:hypothetical protein